MLPAVPDPLLFLGGLILLVVGSDRAVRIAAGLAKHYGVTPIFIGVTVMSIGTSLPEMTMSVIGSYLGAGDLVVGSIVGSETSQITLAVGTIALIAPMVAKRANVALYGGAMLVAMILMLLTLTDGQITRLEAALLVGSYAFFLYQLFDEGEGEEIAEAARERGHPVRGLAEVLVGLIIVVLGARLLIEGASGLAESLGVPTYAVGLMAGLGTTLPEITVGSLAAHRGHGGLTVGSVLGSNITDPVLSLGLGALVRPIVVTQPAEVLASTGYMLLVSALVVATMWWRKGLPRWAAIGCILLYLPAYLVL